MSAVVRLENVSKRFVLRHEKFRSLQDTVVSLVTRRNGSHEEFWALRDVSFEVQPGEMLGIIGRNGSGKSTILKLITRILEPTVGRVTAEGKVSALIELGAGFHPDLTGRENIYLNGSILGFGRREMNRRFDDIVVFSGLERFIDTPVKHYSSGMYMRLGFSVAVAVDPDLLIIDEVLAVGDEAFQRKCLDRIHDLKAQGATILFVSHALDPVKMLCDRALWLESGVIRQIGPSAEVVDAYMVESNVVGLTRVDPKSADGVADGAVGGVEMAPDTREASHAANGNAAGAGKEPRRWGNREVVITGVELLDAGGVDRRDFISGERLVARMHYRADSEVRDPVFGIAIYTAGGVQVTGPNTSTSGFAIPDVLGEGYVDYVVDGLPLTPGAYELSAAVYDHTCTVPYDHHHRAYPFDVRRGVGSEILGLVRIPCRWEHVPESVLLDV